MNYNMFLTIIGTAGTVLSFVYAVYANRKYGKLVDYNREMAWEMYRQVSYILGVIQNLKRIKNNGEERIELLAQGEGRTQELILNSMKMIKRFEKKYDEETINSWHEKGRLSNETHVKGFQKYI